MIVRGSSKHGGLPRNIAVQMSQQSTQRDVSRDPSIRQCFASHRELFWAEFFTASLEIGAGGRGMFKTNGEYV